MMSFCSECGLPLPEGASVCPGCGASILDQILASRRPGSVAPVVETPVDQPVLEEAVEERAEEGSSLQAEAAPGEEKVAEHPPSAEEVAVPPTTWREVVSALRFLLDRQRILWHGTGVMIGWVLFVLFQMLAYVAEESPWVSLVWRVGAWGVLSVVTLMSSAVLAASLLSEAGPALKLPWSSPSGILRRTFAIVGPVVLFLGIGGMGILILTALGALARAGAVGPILWALLFIPQFVLMLLMGLVALAALGAFVYGPALAVTDGGTFQQTLYRLSLLLRRQSAQAVGYLLLGLGVAALLGVLVEGGIGVVIQGIERVALWASQGRSASLIAVGKELVSACVPGSFWLPIGEASPDSAFPPEASVRSAGFFWAISVMLLLGLGLTLPLLFLNGFGALAAWTLLERLSRARPLGEEGRFPRVQ